MVESGRGMAAGGRARARLALVAIEAVLAVVLVCGAGLLVRSFVALLSVNPGFQASGVVTMQTTVPGDTYADPARASQFYGSLLDRVSAVPGVQRAGLINTPPLSGQDANGAFLHEGQEWSEISSNWTAQSASYRVVSGDYFQAMGIPIVRGRTFGTGDVAGAEYRGGRQPGDGRAALRRPRSRRRAHPLRRHGRRQSLAHHRGCGR